MLTPSDPAERPVAEKLYSQHPFCAFDPNYHFMDTELFSKIGKTDLLK